MIYKNITPFSLETSIGQFFTKSYSTAHEQRTLFTLSKNH